ncbi:nitroreductase family protein [Endozoicomonadaceae bacterium StTr2]
MSVDLARVLSSRYATKVFDADKPAAEEKIQQLIETLRLAPSSINSQPWHFYVISNPEEKRRLSQCAWDSNKAKFDDASHVFVFCGKTSYEVEDLQALEELVAEQRGTEVNQARVEFLGGFVNSMDETERKYWIRDQVYLAFGQFLLSCALLELDACPVEGFSREEMDELLGLKEKGLGSVVVGIVGHRHEDDFNTPVKASKVRYPMEQVVTEIR